METRTFTGMWDSSLVIAWAGLPETAFSLDREDGIGRLTVYTPDGYQNAMPGDMIEMLDFDRSLFRIHRTTKH